VLWVLWVLWVVWVLDAYTCNRVVGKTWSKRRAVVAVLCVLEYTLRVHDGDRVGRTKSAVEQLTSCLDSRRTPRSQKHDDGSASLDPPPERWGSVRGATFKPTGSPLLLSVARSATLSPTASSTSRRRVNALGVVDVIIPPPLHVQTLLPPPAASEGAASTRRSPGARSVFERNIAPSLGVRDAPFADSCAA